MPFEVFRKIPFAVDVDSVTIRNGSLTFGEIHPQNRTPGHLYWDGISVKVAGLSTRDLEGGSPLFSFSLFGLSPNKVNFGP